MLNKPKFLSPSLNMQGNTTIDLTSETVPFSCVVDGNEAITHFRIVVSKLSDNTVIFDTQKIRLSAPFYPTDNRNQNNVFNINLRDYCYLVRTENDKYSYVLKTQCGKVESVDESGNTTYTYMPFLLVGSSDTYKSTNSYYSYDKTLDVYSKCDDAGGDIWKGFRNAGKLYYVNATLIANNSSFVNSTEPFCWKITFSGAHNGEISSAEEVFYANTIPQATIYCNYKNDFLIDGNMDSNLILPADSVKSFEKRRVFLKAIYSQAEDVLIKRYGWRLTDIDSKAVLVDTITKNQIYGIADDISCEYNGLVNGSTYLVELYVETQNGYFDILSSAEFKVSYGVKTIDADLEIVPLNDTAGIMLNWGNLKTTEGAVEGREDVRYEHNIPYASYGEANEATGSVSANIPEGSFIVFSGTANGKNLHIDENAYVALSFQFDKTHNATLFEMSGEDEYLKDISRELTYTVSDNTLRYKVTKGEIVAIDSIVLSPIIGERIWYIVKLSPMIEEQVVLEVKECIAEDGLFSDSALYPDDDLYPTFGKWTEIKEG